MRLFQFEKKTPVPSSRHRIRRPARLSILVVTILLIGLMLTILNIYQLQQMKEEHSNHKFEIMTAVEGETGHETSGKRAPVVWIEGKNQHTGYLKHVEAVFLRLGFTVIKENKGEMNWDLLWVHKYPFTIMAETLAKLKPYQRVNHLPGSGYVTNKGSLIVIDHEVIPLAFKLPGEKDSLLEHTKKYPDKLWVQKNNNHRGIKIVPFENLNLTSKDTFVQEFVAKPFLIGGRKFDIGVYTIITSVDPLRIYIITDEVLLRFCSKDYYPFDTAETAKYVVNDNYTPIWEMPMLKELYSKKMFGAKETLNQYMASKGLGKNMSKVWQEIEETIPKIYFARMSSLKHSVRNFKSPRHFFELVRFDFVLDKDMKLFLMEVNLSPNLSSGHFPPNRLLYEHVVYNTLRVTGIASMVENHFHHRELHLKEMLVSERDIAVFPEWCGSDKCKNNCDNMRCLLCNTCLSTITRQQIKDAYLEHVNRGSCGRIFPPSLNQTEALAWSPEKDVYNLNQFEDNVQLTNMWFIGMCRKTIHFCV